MQPFRLYVKGVPYAKRMYTKGAHFLSKWYTKGQGVGPRGGASPQRTLLSSPPGPHSTRQLHRLVPGIRMSEPARRPAVLRFFKLSPCVGPLERRKTFTPSSRQGFVLVSHSLTTIQKQNSVSALCDFLG